MTDKTDWELRQAKKHEKKQADMMLTNFLRAKTAEEKRAVIESFAPYYFVFGTDLKPKREDDGDTLQG